MTNLLRNPSVEVGWTRETHTGQEFGEVFVPEGWTAYWREGGTVPHDPANANGYGRPEMHVINREAPFLDPPRIRSGERALQFFTFYRIHDAGVYQVVEGLTPGQRVMATGWAHGWSSAKDDARCSDGSHVGCGPVVLEEGAPGLDDADRNMTFRVGIDPTGATDPWGDTVIWGPGRHIYNAFAQILPVEVEAEAEAVTVFVRSRVLWPFKHCDAYIDDMSLVVVAEAEEPGGEGAEEPEPAEGLRRSIASVHLIGDNGFLEHYALMLAAGYGLTGVKGCATMGVLGDVKALDPDIVTLGRYINGTLTGVNVECPNIHGDLRAKARQVMDSLLPLWEQHRAYVDIWEVTNELDPVAADGHRRLAVLFLHILDIAEAEGYRIAALSYSLGVPEYPEMAAVAGTGLLERLKAGRHGLSLHEYANPMNQWFGQKIPGAVAHPDRGPLACRFKFWEDFTGGPAGMPDVYLTEVNLARDLVDVDPEEWVKQMRWYIDEVKKSPYVKMINLFTWGEWDRFDISQAPYDDVWHQMAIDTAGVPGGQPEPEPAGYDRVVIIADPTYMDADQIASAYGRGHEELRTVTPSWNDAVLPQENRPDEWSTNTVYAGPLPAEDREEYKRWVDDRDPGTVLVFDKVEEPDPPVEGDLTIVDVRDQMPTNPESPWYPWKRRTFAEITHVFVHHSTGAASNFLGTVMAIAAYHTRATGKNRPGICYTYVIGSDGTVWQTADVEDVVFSQGSVDHPRDENRWGVGVCLLGNFVEYGGREPSGAQIESLTQLIGLISRMVGRPLRVWGHQDVAETRCPGDSWPWQEGWGREIEPQPEPVPAPVPEPVLIGFNDHSGQSGSGLKWLMDNELPGLIVQPLFLGGTPVAFDAREAEAAGIRVILNLRYSWSTDHGGAGTLPAPGSAEWGQFIDAAVGTIETSPGVWGITVSNEANNPREWPRDKPLAAGDVVVAYNAIRARAPAGTRMSPGALDPFNAQAGDPREWLRQFYAGINGAEFVAVHGYVRGPDPDLVGSPAKFQDAPLQWQFLNYPGCVTALLEALPAGYRDRPRYVTELNHLWRTVEGDWGWVDDERAAEVVRRMIIATKAAGLAGGALYRWAGDEWELEFNMSVQEVVRGHFS